MHKRFRSNQIGNRYFDFVDVDVLEFLLELLHAHFHRVDRRLRILHTLDREVLLLQVERLLLKLRLLLLIPERGQDSNDAFNDVL